MLNLGNKSGDSFVGSPVSPRLRYFRLTCKYHYPQSQSTSSVDRSNLITISFLFFLEKGRELTIVAVVNMANTKLRKLEESIGSVLAKYDCKK